MRKNEVLSPFEGLLVTMCILAGASFSDRGKNAQCSLVLIVALGIMVVSLLRRPRS